MKTPRACVCCGATAADGAKLPAVKPIGRRLECTDCAAMPEHVRAARIRARLDELRRLRERSAKTPRNVARSISRRSYRARLRVRQASAQLDLVDLIVPSP
jgi:hypothetical protein